MGRARKIGDAELLEKARRLFLREGASASTKEIAKAAGISEAALFKRYPTKGALLLAALEPPAFRPAQPIGEPRLKNDSLESLTEDLECLLAYFETVVVGILPALGDPKLRQAIAKRMRPNSDLSPSGTLRWRLHHEAEAGRISGSNKEAAASVLVFALYGLALCKAIGLYSNPKIPPLVEALWRGLEPELKKRGKSPRRRTSAEPSLFENA